MTIISIIVNKVQSNRWMKVVKSTSVIEKLIAALAPHYCLSCKAEGSPLCQACLVAVVNNDDLHCFRCFQPTAELAVCRQCRSRTPLNSLVACTSYDGAIERLIYAYKFERMRAAADILATILDHMAPYFDPDTVVSAVPTSRAHIRQRGYDHVQLFARAFARQRGLLFVPTLARHHQLRQLGRTRAARLEQAKTAFSLLPASVSDRFIVIVDDVTTTGATIEHAARCLRAGGAARVHGLVIAQQRLTDIT